MASYRLEIVVDGRDAGASGVLDRIKGGLGGIATVAGGILTAGLFRQIGDGIRSLIGDGVNAAASMQNLALSLETLVAKEIARGEETTVARQKIIGLTDKEKEKLQDLELEYQTLGARMNEEKERIRQMTEEWTDQGLNVQTAKARLAEMENQYAKIGGQMDELRAKEGQLVTVQETIRTNTKTMGEALGEAGPKAAELGRKLRDLSLVSPFEFEMLANVMRANLAFGATTENVIPLTKAITDMAAGLGLTEEQFDRMSYNMAQALLAGDLTAANLRQLRMVGVDLATVFEDELGMSIKEVDAALKSGKMTAQDVSAAFMAYVENNFGGAAERLSKTWQGLQSSFADLKFFAGSDILGPSLEILTVKLGELFDKGRALLEDGTFQKIGDELGKFTSALLSGDVPGTIDALVKALGGMGLPQGAQDVISALTPFFQALKEAWEGDWGDALLNFAAGVGDLGEALGLWDAETGNKIALFILEAGRAAADYAGDVAEFLAGLADTAYQVAMEWWAENGDGLAGSFADIGEAAAALKEAIGPLFEDVAANGPGFSEFFAALAGAGLDEMAAPIHILAEAMGGMAEEWPEFKAMLDDFKAWWEWLTGGERETEEPSLLLDALAEGFGNLANPISSSWEQMKNINTAMDTLTGLVGELLTAAKTDLPEAFEEVKGWGADVVAEIGKLPAKADEAITNATEAIKKIGGRIVDGIKQGIADAWDGFIAWIIGQMGTILTAIAEFFNIGSPAKRLIPYGAALPAGLQVGWRASFAEFERAVAGDMAGMMGAFGGGFGFGARPAFAGATAPAAPAGDTITQTFYVQDRLAAAMLGSSLRASQQARLNSRI